MSVAGNSKQRGTDYEVLVAAMDASGDVAYEWDLATDRVSWCGPAARLFQCEAAALPDRVEAFHSRINPEDLPLRLRTLSEHFAGGSDFDCEYRIRTETGDFQWVHDRGAVQRAHCGQPDRLIGLLRLVTQRKQYEARLEFLANFDDLTGHYNKVRVRQALDHAIEECSRSGALGAFIVIGVDQMGMINSAYGFEAGDAVLVELGQRLDRAVRGSDVIGRLGGDRFGVVLGHSSPEGVAITAERILQIVRQTPIAFGGEQIHVTASVSMVMVPEHSKTSFDAITKAEGALLQAKVGGGDCARLYQMTEEQRSGYRASMSVGERVKDALKEDRFTLAFQPVVEAATGEVRFYECLLRMIAPDGDVVPAGAFVPAVEQLGLMRTIDRLVLDLAVRDLQANPQIQLAINISGLTAADHAWLRALINKVRGHREIAERMIVEITETAALHDIDESARFVSAVRDLGCKVAIDDFGAGYTSFQHLRALAVDIVKIDGSFVRNVSTNPENQAFVRNLMSLAKTLNLTAVAEFVETAEDATFLADQGVDYLQGYYFGKPDLAPSWKAAREAPAESGKEPLRAAS